MRSVKYGSGRGFAADLHILPRLHPVFRAATAARLSSQDFSTEMRFGSVLMRLRARRVQIPVCLCRAADGRDAVSAASHCTEFGQGPVDELHIIENMTDRVLSWELTLFSSRVKSLSFFDRFRTVFPVGGESGAQAQLTAVRTAKKAGIAGQRVMVSGGAHAASFGIGS